MAGSVAVFGCLVVQLVAGLGDQAQPGDGVGPAAVGGQGHPPGQGGEFLEAAGPFVGDRVPGQWQWPRRAGGQHGGVGVVAGDGCGGVGDPLGGVVEQGISLGADEGGGEGGQVRDLGPGTLPCARGGEVLGSGGGPFVGQLAGGQLLGGWGRGRRSGPRPRARRWWLRRGPGPGRAGSVLVVPGGVEVHSGQCPQGAEQGPGRCGRCRRWWPRGGPGRRRGRRGRPATETAGCRARRRGGVGGAGRWPGWPGRW